ncbi:LuxR C-terminal-related transcriptional regulator [Pseudomonas asiatica]|uniref:LuxR C-terminal-related transcriptional regulator n=1 Tax=Pseudomonas TaxID=286 RepID=UPI0002A17821|nr:MULTISPECIES: LuxR C-terminal-related transcriptional regulator [Pseudomonas]AGA74865.1 LuxR family transcriptional regulator [Pseudomonas putida HB3267]MCE0753947.1 LuxR C-terminal-related transcriptional regulator [Pseudomonas asiatica]MCE1029816.1 LuxR C-terminal-related transcriptional regulator [Pseudomonas asiatica]MDM3874005.1 LuxR C-terminal-related transcriptional regulator [Pseudomonas asiatica]PLP87517.1 helix-turn-helix transcriptional regulator [Pseudomonas sp. FFUP_PS_41]
MTTQTITTGGWTGRLDMGLAPRELEATLLAAADLTVKQVAQVMGIAPKTVEKRLEAARLKLGSKTIRGLVLEAFKRQIISPAATALALMMVIHGMIGDDQILRIRRSGGGSERKVELRVAARRVEQFQVA